MVSPGHSLDSGTGGAGSSNSEPFKLYKACGMQLVLEFNFIIIIKV